MIQNSDFFHFLFELTRHESNSELTHLSGKRLWIRPEHQLTFPVRDVDAITENQEQIRVNCLFMGLYGVDSPLPGYLNELCLRHDEQGETLRDFLDLLNHRNYVLFFLAWKAFQPDCMSDSNQADYFRLISNLSGHYVQDASKEYPVNHLINGNPLSLAPVIQYFVPHCSYKIHTFISGWVPLTELKTLGQIVLGENGLLGERVYQHAHGIRVELGPMTWEQAAELLPQGRLGRFFVRMLRTRLESFVDLTLQIRIIHPSNCLCLGRDVLYLGQYAWLGCWREADHAINMPESVYF